MVIHHFNGIKFQDGNVDVKIPNSIFKLLSTNIKSANGGANSPQISFTYTYLVAVSFLYRYAYFVDLNQGTYIQNGDIKELLGYSRTTKSVNKIIKKGGLTDELGLTKTVNDYPVSYYRNNNEKINDIPLVEFLTLKDIEDSFDYDKIKGLVKNRNYEVKEPLFMTTKFDDNEYGTMYNMERTHSITIDELIAFISDDELNNGAFLVYAYLKSICKGYKKNKRDMAVYKIVSNLGMDKSVFYNHLTLLKKKGYVEVEHKKWNMEKKEKMEANTYYWKGV